MGPNSEIPEYSFPKKVRVALYQCIRLGVDRPDIGLAIGALKVFVEKYSASKVTVDTFTTLTKPAFYKSLKTRKYDLLGISAVSVVFDESLQLISEVTNLYPKIKIILGGAHITCLPQTLPESAIGVIGEGELTFLELCALTSQQKLNPTSLEEIKGIVYWKDSRLKITPLRELIKNLDIIPPFNRDYFTSRAPAAVFTIRGCPFKCDFCVNYILWQHKVRMHSPEWVTADLVNIRKREPDVKTVVFRDDIMMLFPKRLQKLADLINKQEELNGLEFVAYGKVDCINKNTVNTLKSMHVKCILFGFESFSKRMLQIYKGNKITPEINQSAINICYDCGMKTGGNFIIGHPSETRKDIEITYECMLKNFQQKKIQTGGNSILTPFPGTPYWQIAREKYNFNECSFDWSRLNELSYLLARLDHCRDWTVYDWWKYREKTGMLYIGALSPYKELLPMMEHYEPLMHKYLNV